MGLLKQLQTLADRLGLVTLVEEEESAPEQMATRQVSLTELTREVEAEQVRALAELPAEMSVPFEKVYEAAGIETKEHGWTIARLALLLKTEQYRSLEREAAQKAVLGILAADSADVADVVADAVSRDKALDAYAEFVRRKLSDRLSARRRKVEELKDKIRELKKEGTDLLDQSEEDEEQFKGWLGTKREAEDELAWAVGYLMDKPIITRDEP